MSGVVESVDGSTFIVKSDDGTSITVTTSSSTTVSLVREAKVSDLGVGDEIMVVGEGGSGSDNGTIAAVRITEGASFGGPGPGGFPGGMNGGPPQGGQPNGGPPQSGSQSNGTTT